MEVASTDLFINLVQNNRVVFDKSLKDFKNIRKKEEAWVNIAEQCRMTVDDAKKKYFSLRQKYCREKKMVETKRRKKLVHRSGWVLYNRLQFLDAFIQPRSTFTNDTEFVEDFDEPLLDGDGMEIVDEDDVTASQQSVRIEVDPSIDANELNGLLDGTEARDTISEQCENFNVLTETVMSEYTGEISEIQFFQSVNQGPDNIQADAKSTDDNYISLHPTTSSSSKRFAKTFDVSTNVKSGNQGPDNVEADVEPTDDNYMSLHPTTSSSSHRFALPFAVSTTGKSGNQEPDNIEADAESTGDNYMSLHPTTSSMSQRFSKPFPVSTTGKSGPIFSSRKPPTSVGISSSSQSPNCQQPPSRCASSTSRSATFRNIVNKPKPSPAAKRSPQNVPNSHVVATPASTSKAHSIDSIRQKMDSCLNVFAKKMTDKENRSPHAPFLAYLGTKLPRVPQEILANVEQQILELVQFHSN